MTNNAIPTEPQEDPSETIMAALAHGMTGDPQAGVKLLKPFFDTPRQLVSLCAALAESAIMPARRENPDADGFALLAFKDGTFSDTREMPVGERFAAQFISAWANGEQQTAYALFNALRGGDSEQDAEHVADGVLALYAMSVASMRALTGRAS
jgi:hypothetical protein